MYKNFEIIDFHTHPYIAIDENICSFKTLVYPGRNMIEDLETACIDIFCGSIISKPRQGETRWDTTKRCNDIALQINNMYPDRYVPGYHIHPDFVNESCEEVKRMYDKGIKLIGELVPYCSDWSEGGDNFAAKGLFDILDYVNTFDNMVVNFHSTIAIPGTIEEMVKRYPNIIFVAAHPGQAPTFLEHIERMKKFENYCLDLSGTGIFRYGMIKAELKKLVTTDLFSVQTIPPAIPECLSEEFCMKIFLMKVKKKYFHLMQKEY